MKQADTIFIERLYDLADFLEKEIDPNLFSYAVFRSDEKGFSRPFISKNDCGSHGCALGWAATRPDAPWAPEASDMGAFECLDFEEYAKRIFGFRLMGIVDLIFFRNLFLQHYDGKDQARFMIDICRKVAAQIKEHESADYNIIDKLIQKQRAAFENTHQSIYHKQENHG